MTKEVIKAKLRKRRLVKNRTEEAQEFINNVVPIHPMDGGSSLH